MPNQSIQQETLKIRKIAIDTYYENVAYMHRDCEIYRAEGFQALSKIEINSTHTKIFAVLNVVDDVQIVAPGELGLSDQAFEQLSVQAQSLVRVAHAEPPHSMDAVRRKIAGEQLSAIDLNEISRDIADKRYSKMEIAAFLVATSQNGLDREEIVNLTKAMIATGDTLSWNEHLVVDKHCIGGIPGNRTTMIVAPIVAAHGTLMPKTSSRAITSPAGTADTMEVLANVNLSPEKMRDVVHHQRVCLAWGGNVDLAPVDDILITVERPLGIDSTGLMVASILSKKLASGSTHLLIDIPVGESAKVKQMNAALRLRKIFEYVGDCLNIHLEVIITDGAQPIGRGIGPVLEARDVMEVLSNYEDAPDDLRQKSLRLAGRLLEFDPDVRGGQGYALARDILESGRALSKMQEIIQAQGVQSHKYLPGTLTKEIVAPSSGYIRLIDNYILSKIARLAGAPLDKGAGVDLLAKIGDYVNSGDAIYRIHAEFPSDYKFAISYAEQFCGYTISSNKSIPGNRTQTPTQKNQMKNN